MTPRGIRLAGILALTMGVIAFGAFLFDPRSDRAAVLGSSPLRPGDAGAMGAPQTVGTSPDGLPTGDRPNATPGRSSPRTTIVDPLVGDAPTPAETPPLSLTESTWQLGTTAMTLSGSVVPPRRVLPTTIPPATQPGPTTPSTTWLSTTTTVTVPLPPAGDDACQAVYQLFTFARSLSPAPADLTELKELVKAGLAGIADRLRIADAMTYSGAISRVERTARAAATADSRDEINVIMTDFFSGGAYDAQETASLTALQRHANAVCPALTFSV